MVNRVMVIAGEASGDLHGSGVVRELRHLHTGIDIYGVGGDRMRNEGMTVVFHINELSFMGFAEVVKHLPMVFTMEKTLEQLLTLKRPDVVVLIDYPGFNLRFAKIAKRYGIKVVYYISPQVWAWRKSRITKMRGVVDQMLVVFPFEVPLYTDEGIAAEFVGHPLVEVLHTQQDRQEFFTQHGLDPQKRLVVLLPGSRVQEVDHIFPVMRSAARRIAERLNLQVAVGVAPTLDEEYFRAMHHADDMLLMKHATYDLMAHADLAIVTSGTATLETALFGTPMMVVYKTSWLTYLIGRLLVRVKNIGLVNIVAGKQIVPEFVQHRATVRNLVSEATAILQDANRLRTMKAELSRLRSLLGASGASRRVAERILQMA
jgi:lipid-A-disaccharide synthase